MIESAVFAVDRTLRRLGASTQPRQHVGNSEPANPIQTVAASNRFQAKARSEDPSWIEKPTTGADVENDSAVRDAV